MMGPEHYRADLGAMIDFYKTARERMVERMREHGAAMTPEQEARWTGQFNAVRDVIAQLETMSEQWAEGAPAFRVTERMLEEAGA